MSDSELIPSHCVPMSDICDNLVSAWALTARYFKLDTCMAVSPEELLRVLSKAHIYLDAHMGILHDFKLVDSHYGLSLRTLICVLVSWIPFEQCPLAWHRWFLTELEMDCNDYKLDKTFSLPGEEGYEVNGDHSVLEIDVRPFHRLVLPPLCRPVAATSTSAPSPASVAPPETPVPLPSIPMGLTINKRPRPTMIKMLEPPKDPVFPPISSQKVEGHRSPSGSPLLVPIISKHKCVQGSATQLPADEPGIKSCQLVTNHQCIGQRASGPKRGTRTSARKAKVAPVHEPLAMLAKNWTLAHSSGNVDLSDSGDEDSALQDIMRNESGQETEEIVSRPIKRVRLVSLAAVSSPPARAYHPITGEPLTGFTYISLSALSEPVQPFPVAGTSSKGKSKGKAHVAALPAPAVIAPVSPVTAIVDNTIYTRGFHPDINLQFHEPPSREALERMKMSLLPAAPDSLTK
ncbi:hypothetical protein IW261DRAFT_1576753 [Armillaria novae-zelandiae]|uniref:Uncharacterized protein n=1 Tax=Armillaria novae-zelandiae TaxID=153914 RepID=A0AA39TWD8_9AGAR|nr:hypothetical protein IW261DRAFT_1576753 [Armillaria novae-zelandiae]